MFRLISHAICSLCIGFCMHAHAETRLAQPIPDSQSLLNDNNNLPAGEFFSAYLSSNIAERRYAQMYLLGVLDATGGISWCDYRLAKTISLEEQVYEGLKKADANQLQKRAALVITGILKDRLPCKDKRK